ncbi:hypothetical protein B0H12DRAFT_1237925 [Mycena haematopus]|nr:hypothetical protein B0H12DRAFT_1237925 [Mycena haematopus]
MRRSLQIDQTLTAPHDNASAWSGIGSATVYLWNQRTLSASVIGVLSTFLYLGNILALHITIPALFSLQSFNSSRSVPVITHGLPAFDFSGYDLSSSTTQNQTCLTGGYTLGLHGGTLYDVPEPNNGTGNVTVNATAFDISCRFLTNFTLEFTQDSGNWNVVDGEGEQLGSIEPTCEVYTLMGQSNLTFPLAQARGIISNVKGVYSTGRILCSTAPIIDSSGNTGSWVTITPNPNTHSPTSIQLLQCSQSLVSQRAIVDSQSHQLIAVTPNMTKTVSVWPSPVSSNFYDFIPESNVGTFPTFVTLNGVEYSITSFLSVGDLFLGDQLGLWPIFSNPTTSVTLHDLENGLSVIFASMWWTMGNMLLAPWFVNKGTTDIPNNNTRPFLLVQGNSTVTEIFVQTRLDLSIIGVAAGLAVSIGLTLISLPSTVFLRHTATTKNDGDIPIDGTGLLHTIWLYRSHPELETLLEQVEHPTHANLRGAGMVRTTLLGRGRRKIYE